jgi:hypothetical protein
VITALLAAALIAGPPPAVEPTDTHPIVVGERRISRGWLRHWADIAQRSGGGDRKTARIQAADLLISSRWIRSEAAELDLVVPAEEVERSFRQQRRKTFPRRRDYRRFLRESGQTRSDVLFRVRIDLQSDRIREHVTAGAATPKEQLERLDAFVLAFRTKWRARTACRRPWINEVDCGTTSPGRTRRAPSRGRRTSSSAGGDGFDRVPSIGAFRRIAPAS